jgi:hypothetical protein
VWPTRRACVLTLRPFFSSQFPAGTFNTFPVDTKLTGTMSVDLTNVFVQLPDGRVKALTDANALSLGKLKTSGDNVSLDIDRHGERRGDRDDH